MTHIFKINGIANQIHIWGEPGQYPWKSMGLTRVSSVVLAAMEAVNTFYSSARFLVWKLPGSLVKKSINMLVPMNPRSYQDAIPEALILKTNLLVLIKSIIGLCSTLFFGIVFSPEMNFRLHQNLGLISDNTTLRKEKAIKAQIEAEIKKVSSQKERSETLAHFQNEKGMYDCLENAEDQEIDANLQKLFILSASQKV